MSGTFDLFASCLPGLEVLLADECASLGAEVRAPDVGSGGVDLRADASTTARLLVGTACSSHLLVRLGQFHARHFAELCRRASALDWRPWLTDRLPFSVRATARRSRLLHTGAIEERMTRVIAERIGTDGTDGGEPIPVHVRMQDDRCTISIDLAGRPLHERGWRLETAKAPLREDLAAGLLRAAGYRGDESFIDPLCGAGTIAIEAALLARRLPPGRLRSFSAERVPVIGPGIVDAARAELLGRSLERAPAPIFASDRDPGAVASVRNNAMRAGVDADLEIACASLSEARGFASGGATGLVACNPPFGRRIGNPDALAPLWQGLGARVRALGPGWRLAVIAADRRSALRTGVALRTAFLSNHGGIRVRGLVGPAGHDEATS